MDKPNIIYIQSDQHTFDIMGCAGDDIVETPNLDRLVSNGSKAEGLKTVYPSKTFPNHISIVTGNYPSNHGIISNYFYDIDFDEDPDGGVFDDG